ncbi:VOC family protein [Amycolatopsis sp. ATCC 39116]|uniref:VOC family protein n=1 Tax=Amycolatopsis sp. (strain ATCC 39116 / 75iv2) TaxID=385957 RepID=UPI0002626518|nr:VOC family protein [Amycolatopsis sp. ATCC 39116]
MSSEISALGYVVVTAEDLAAWRSFAEGVLGLEVAEDRAQSDDSGTLLLRMDDHAWRIAVEQGPDGGIGALGFEVSGLQALESLKKRLSAAGVPVKDLSSLAVERQVLGLFGAQDPDGTALEFYYGGRMATSVFRSPRSVSFLTGSQGLGHAVLWVSDVVRAREFYIDLLGFRLTDIIDLEGMTLYFTSPNERHHSLAFASAEGKSGLQHIMLEVTQLDGVGRALDLALASGGGPVSTLGRHTNDKMVSFYCTAPSGLHVEYGCGAVQIDDSVHTTGYYTDASYWGHRPWHEQQP